MIATKYLISKTIKPDINSASGIYFLLDNKEIVYVGEDGICL